MPNVIVDTKTTASDGLSINDIQYSSATENTIYTRLTNDDDDIPIDWSEQITTNSSDKMSQRERRLQERWSTSSKSDKADHQQSTKNLLLGIEFPPIAVLRKKFSSSSPSSAITNKQNKNKFEVKSNEILNQDLLTTNTVSIFE